MKIPKGAHETETTFSVGVGDPLPKPGDGMMGQSPLTGIKYIYHVSRITKLEWATRDGQPCLLVDIKGWRKVAEEE